MTKRKTVDRDTTPILREIRPRSITIVDDSKSTVIMYKQYLASRLMELEIQVAHDGKEAWKLFQKSPTALALLDLEMPGLNGLQLAKKIRAFSPNTVILVVSGNLDDDTTESLMELQAGWASKPIKASALVLRTAEAFDRFANAEKVSELEVLDPEIQEILTNLRENPRCDEIMRLLKPIGKLNDEMLDFLVQMSDSSKLEIHLGILIHLLSLDDEAREDVLDTLYPTGYKGPSITLKRRRRPKVPA